MVVSRDQNAGLRHNIKIDTTHLKEWKTSNILEQPKQIKFLFREKLKAD
jgi:hypothetical protein